MQYNPTIKPLTHLNEQTGRPYERRLEVERKLQEALTLEPAVFLARIKQSDRTDPLYLDDECLVYFLREYTPGTAGKRLAGDIFEELRRRTEKFIRFELRTLDAARQEDAWQDVMPALFSKITGPNDLGDFAQVNFRTFLAAKVSDVKRKYRREQYRDIFSEAPSWVYGTEPRGELASEDKYPEPTTESELGEDVMNHELLDALSPDDRRLVELRILGLPIEHMDPGVPTISRYFNVTPRTINNRLRALQRFTKEWLEKEKGS